MVFSSSLICVVSDDFATTQEPAPRPREKQQAHRKSRDVTTKALHVVRVRDEGDNAMYNHQLQ